MKIFTAGLLHKFYDFHFAVGVSQRMFQCVVFLCEMYTAKGKVSYCAEALFIYIREECQNE